MIKSLFLSILSIFALMTYAQTDGYAPSDGLKIHYKVYGTGKPIVLLNGGPGYSSRHFEEFAALLSKNNYQVIIFDQRGTGLSTLNQVDANTVTIAKMVGDMEALRTHLKLEKWTVLGYSFGGMYAMSYAVKHQDKLNGLILSASGGIDLNMLPYYNQNMMARLSAKEIDSLQYWSQFKTEQAEYKKLAILSRAYVYSPKHQPIVLKMFTEVAQYYPLIEGLVFQDLMKTKYDLTPQFKKFKKPCIILYGRQDFLGEENALRIEKGIPKSKLVFINECNHYLWIEQKEIYFKEIDAFMGTLAN